MGVEQNWKALDKGYDEDLSSLIKPGKIERLHSSDPIQKIRHHLKIGIWFSILISALYLVIMILYPLWPILICIGIVLIFSVWGGYTSWIHYKNLGVNTINDGNLLETLERHHRSITEWMKVQLRVSLLVYPFATAGGFVVGALLGSGKPLEAIFSKTFVIVALIVTIALLVPAAYYLAKWLFRISYQNHLRSLREKIEVLKSPDA